MFLNFNPDDRNKRVCETLPLTNEDNDMFEIHKSIDACYPVKPTEC